MTGLEVFGVQVATKLTNMAVSRVLDGLMNRQDESLALLNVQADVYMTLALVEWTTQRTFDAQRHSTTANRLLVEGITQTVEEQNKKWRQKRIIYKRVGLGPISLGKKESAQITQNVTSLMTLCDRACESARFLRALGGDIGETKLLRLDYIPESIERAIRVVAVSAARVPITKSTAPPQIKMSILP